MKLENGNYPPPGIFWNLEEGHHHSFRLYESYHDKFLIVVAAPHKVGQESEPGSGFENLTDFAHEHFGAGHVTHRWAGQHYRPADTLPYIGRMAGSDTIYMATGFATDGLIYGTVAAKIITDDINGTQNEYHDIYDSLRVEPSSSAADFIRENLNVALQYLKDIANRLFSHPDISDIPAGSARVVEIENKKWAVYKDENGEPHIVSASCTHLGCIVNWNSGERSWDCPCHGSRFTIQGDVIEGPALTRLASMEGISNTE